MKKFFPYFKDFCRKYRNEVDDILKTKIVQTNEVRRCAYLYPVFAYIHKLTNSPLALVEIGTSAGLQLLWDQYGYSYGSGSLYGKEASTVQIVSEIRGEGTPLLPLNSPPVGTRVGIDLKINDLSDEQDFLWLNALIWPEHKNRRRLFEKAAAYVLDQDIKFIEGDGVEWLSRISGRIPPNQTLCIFHTHVANQMSPLTNNRLLDTIKEIGKNRNIFHIYNNIQDGKLHLDYYLDEEESLNTIAETDDHGSWFSWLYDGGPGNFEKIYNDGKSKAGSVEGQG